MATVQTRNETLEWSKDGSICATVGYVAPAFFVIKAVIAILVITAASLFYTAAHAADWSTEDVVSESVFQTVNAVDALQTLYIAKHPNQYAEVGLAYAIGSHPSGTDAVLYIAAQGVGHALVSQLLLSMDSPVWVRRTWQAVTLTPKLKDVSHNYSIGIRMEF